MLQKYKFDSGIKGKSVLLLGGIHGDEVCGVVALSEIVKQFQSGRIIPQKGSVTIVPMCNPKAYEKNVRFIDRNLNRYMSPILNPSIYEDDLTNELCPLLEEADILLDIHSYHEKGVPFAYVLGANTPEVDFARSIGVEHMVYGFANAYQNVGDKTPEESIRESMGTTEYMRQFDGVGFTLECGQHKDPNSIAVAEMMAINTLLYSGVLDGVLPVSEGANMVEISKVFYGKKGCSFSQEWKNFGVVPAETVIGVYGNGEEIVAPYDCCIVQPWKNVPEGLEWFYMGKLKGGGLCSRKK